MGNKKKLFFILMIQLSKNLVPNIDFQPFNAYVPRGDTLNILTDIKYFNDKI
ncbi:hypothetical protein GF385_02000, partial [Candidatus Dependentiae bacterium]|nr:hypothetical protein [Candidatus Dependentiae bacterium]